MLFSFIFRCYKESNSFTGYLELIRQFCAVLLTCTMLFLLNVIGIFKAPISVLIMFGILTFLLTYSTRAACFFIQKVKTGANPINNKKTSRVLIVGMDSDAPSLIKFIKECSKEDITPVAYVDDTKDKNNIINIGVNEVGTSNDIDKIVKDNDIDRIIIACPSSDCNAIRKMYQKCIFPNVQVKLLLKSNAVNDLEEEDESLNYIIKDIGIEDMLFYNRVSTTSSEVKDYISGKTVLVTGGAGSIGSELCRQALDNKCKRLIIFDFSENDLFELNEEFKKKYSEERFELVLGSVRDKICVDEIFKKFKPDIVFHAAAHKHVPMIELNPIEAVKNNIVGTMNIIDSCKKYKVSKFILISTDKAVNPTSIMGASKRVAELIVKAENGSSYTEMASVRFGNVLGSQGSVVPLFEKQIAAGGPVTITDPEMVRFFMSIPEAVSLVQTAAVAAKGGETFVLDMGSPIKIYDLACDLIRLHGFEPHEDIDIVYTGLRPGEKLFEELSLENETIDITSNSKIFVMRSEEVNQIALYNNINNILKNIKQEQDLNKIRKLIFDTIELNNLNIEADVENISISAINSYNTQNTK